MLGNNHRTKHDKVKNEGTDCLIYIAPYLSNSDSFSSDTIDYKCILIPVKLDNPP